MAEGTVGVISTFILSALRNRRFLSLWELNEAIRELLYKFNHKPFQKKDDRRASVFEDERVFLLPLSSSRYNMSTWNIATVGHNYHINVEKMNYSVFYEYIKQELDVQITKSTIEVFFGGNRICPPSQALWPCKSAQQKAICPKTTNCISNGTATSSANRRHRLARIPTL